MDQLSKQNPKRKQPHSRRHEQGNHVRSQQRYQEQNLQQRWQEPERKQRWKQPDLNYLNDESKEHQTLINMQEQRNRQFLNQQEQYDDFFNQNLLVKEPDFVDLVSVQPPTPYENVSESEENEFQDVPSTTYATPPPQPQESLMNVNSGIDEEEFKKPFLYSTVSIPNIKNTPFTMPHEMLKNTPPSHMPGPSEEKTPSHMPGPSEVQTPSRMPGRSKVKTTSYRMPGPSKVKTSDSNNPENVQQFIVNNARPCYPSISFVPQKRQQTVAGQFSTQICQADMPLFIKCFELYEVIIRKKDNEINSLKRHLLHSYKLTANLTSLTDEEEHFLDAMKTEDSD